MNLVINSQQLYNSTEVLFSKEFQKKIHQAIDLKSKTDPSRYSTNKSKSKRF